MTPNVPVCVAICGEGKKKSFSAYLLIHGASLLILL